MAAALRMRLREAPFCVSVLLAALIAVEAARLSLAVFGGQPAASVPLARHGSPASHRPRLNVEAIVAAHVFGIALGSPGAADAAPAAAVNLVLEGVLANSDSPRGVAIIRSDAGVNVYRVGAAVGSAVLQSVLADHVLLIRGGAIETVALPRSARLETASGGRSVTAAPAVRSVKGATLGDVVSPGESVAGPSGALRGFRVFPRANRGAFGATGLRGGDLVTAIDGNAVADMHQEDVRRVFDAVRGASTVNFTVENINGSHEVTVDLAQADADTSTGP